MEHNCDVTQRLKSVVLNPTQISENTRAERSLFVWKTRAVGTFEDKRRSHSTRGTLRGPKPRPFLVPRNFSVKSWGRETSVNQEG